MPALLLLSGCQEAGVGAAVVSSLVGGSGDVGGENESYSGIISQTLSSDLDSALDTDQDPPVLLDEPGPSVTFDETNSDNSDDPSDSQVNDETPPLSHMPEPGSLLLFGPGLLASAFGSRIRKVFSKKK